MRNVVRKLVAFGAAALVVSAMSVSLSASAAARSIHRGNHHRGSHYRSVGHRVSRTEQYRQTDRRDYGYGRGYAEDSVATFSYRCGPFRYATGLCGIAPLSY